MIEVTYDARHSLPIETLVDFQGNAKTITQENLDKLKGSIRKHGFFVPVFVWRKTATSKCYIIDGHQRVKALMQLKAEGEDMPPVPVEYIAAKSKKDAAEKLLAVTSQFGEFDIDGLAAFAEGFQLALTELDLRLVDTPIEFTVPLFEPVGEDEQGRLDELAPKIVVCPHCGKEFDLREND